MEAVQYQGLSSCQHLFPQCLHHLSSTDILRLHPLLDQQGQIQVFSLCAREIPHGETEFACKREQQFHVRPVFPAHYDGFHASKL